jgi:hypothetical protein
MVVCGAVVPIRPLLQNEEVFSPEDITALTTAFENVLSDLGLADRDDPIVTMVAKRIIELARKGELDPILLRDYVVRQFQARSRL